MARKKVDGSKNMFDFITAITENQTDQFFDSLTDEELKLYKNSRYMINRFLSMNAKYLEVINAAQSYSMMPDRMHYKFLSGILPKKKQYQKYIKATTSIVYPKWLIELIAKHYLISTTDAIDYLDIFYKHNKKELRLICEMYAVDPNLLLEAKL